MASSPSSPDVPTTTLPVPHPTHPVAGRSVSDDAPAFQWIAVPDVTEYRLQLAASEAFETLYHDDVVEGPTTIALGEALPDDVEEVVWRVRAVGERAPWSPPAHFVVAQEEGEDHSDTQFLVDAPPMPIYPVNGDAVDADAPAFTWDSVPAASGYRVQVSRTQAFDDPEVDLMVDRTTALTLFGMLPDERERLYWRICALFPNGTEGPWSEAAELETDPEVGTDEDIMAEGDMSEVEPETTSPERSPVAAGPARHSRTSGAAALASIGILIVSFLATLMLIAIYG